MLAGGTGCQARWLFSDDGGDSSRKPVACDDIVPPGRSLTCAQQVSSGTTGGKLALRSLLLSRVRLLENPHNTIEA